MIPRVRVFRTVATAMLCAAVLTFWPGEALAQRRGVRIRGGVRAGAAVVVPPLYAGFGYYDPFWWGWGPAWGPAWYPPFGPAFAGSNVGSARLQVTPKQAEVYVDGYLAGTVDDFDGFFQRLDIAPGEHELTLYLAGYETITERVLFRPGATLDIRHRMQPLAPGETSGPRPTAGPPPAPPPSAGGAPPPGAHPRDRQRRFPEAAPPDGAYGTLALRVQPADATILIDGEAWEAPEGDGPILIDLPDGPHDVEIRVDGRPPYRRTIQVRAGRTIPLNVSVSR